MEPNLLRRGIKEIEMLGEISEDACHAMYLISYHQEVQMGRGEAIAFLAYPLISVT
jgi:hypothetical protein